jgi:NADPH-dependent 2,4-dienoyl-CoA reductase/sulfur reductase-like enzyme/nitrite reductase/ring-hydroxylating ferredoxin subunit
MMTSYYLFQSKFLFSEKRALLAEQIFKRLSLEGCELMLEGEMKEVKYGTKDNESVLVVMYEGKLRALSNYCPHFGAPMHTGVLIDNVIKCPWHGASFDILTGVTDISPSIDNLPVYEVLSDSQGFYINLPEEVKHSVRPTMSKRDINDNRKFVIVGGGPAGLSAAEGLRQNGYTGEIIILSQDSNLPYDRSILSKFIPPTVNKILLRPSEFLNEYDINVHTNVTVSSIDNKNRKVKLQDGQELSYDKLLLASGGSPIIPNIPGNNQNNVFVLRSFDDLQKISAACKTAKNIVIIGGSFIGMESASTLKKTFPSTNITIVEINPTPFFKILGKEIGSALQVMHESKGIQFKLGKGVSQIKDNSVILDDGTSLDAEVILVGAGISPNTNYIKDEIAMDGKFVKTDLYLNTTDENVFAAGDVASVPYFKNGEQLKFGHYVSAQQQGAVAAANMLGKRIPYEYVPFFWSRQWDKGLQYTGYGVNFDDVFIEGNLSEPRFVAYYFERNKIVGFAAMNTPNAANIMYEAFRNDRLPSASAIKNGSSNLEKIKTSLKRVKVKCLRADCVCERRRQAQAQSQAQH